MHKKSLILSIIYFHALVLAAQYTISGSIADISGDPLPFATVYIGGSTNGTTSNAEGDYTLKVSSGEKEVVVQYTGYARQVKTSPGGNQVIDFRMEPETLVLAEVIVKGEKDDNAARRIIRNTINKRKYYAGQIAAFSTEVYVKGIQRLDERPKSLLGLSVNIDTGVVYLSESISQLKYLHPGQFNETMISSKVSGDNKAFSYNQASEMMINLYDNNFFVQGLSERPFISPLSSNAFLYYNYELAGTIEEGDLFIYKVRLLPKRRTDPVFGGYIYVIDGSWRLHSVEVSLKKANGLEFLESLQFNQVFAPLDYGIWMPISQRFSFQFETFGFKGSGHFTAIYRNYQIQPNYWEKEALKGSVPPKQVPLFSKKDFSNAILTVKEGANKRDSLYWAEARPIPLTPLEIKDYQVKDSLKLIRESKPYQDSLDQQRNKFRMGNLIFNGYTHANNYNGRYYTFPTLLNSAQYNAVEGAVANLEVTYSKRNEDLLNYRITPALRYGFAIDRFNGKIEAQKQVSAKSREFLLGGMGRYIYQINEQEPISTWQNSWFTFFHGRNLARFYEKGFLYAGYQREVINGLLLSTRLDYEDRRSLDRAISFNIRDNTIAENIPNNIDPAKTSFGRHQALLLQLRLRIRFDQKYIDRPDRKINLASSLPELYVHYKRATPILGTDLNFDFVKAGAIYEKRLGTIGTSKWAAWAGKHFNRQAVSFIDFQHFNGNRTYFRSSSEHNAFQLLDYYLWSTTGGFVQGHYEHHFNEFILNKLPFIKRLNWQAVGSVNFLHTDALPSYFEFGVGIEHIFKILRVDYYTSFQNGEHGRSSIRLGFGF